jgi:hypothetical protein
MILKSIKYSFIFFILTNINLLSDIWENSLDSAKYYYYKGNPELAIKWGEYAKKLADSLYTKKSSQYENTL